MRVLAAALLALWTLVSCTPRPAPAGEPALWRIADADSEIWLFGAVHVLPPDLRWRSARFDAAFDAAEELVVETDADAAITATLAARYGVLPAGERLTARLAPSSAARLRRVAAQVRLDAAALENLRPWLAALRLSFAYALADGQAPEAGVEAVLMPAARGAGKRISFLETPEQQIRTLADLSEPDQLRFLNASLRQIEEEGDSLAALDAAWARGDVAALDALLRAQLHEAGEAPYAAIITRRNAAWTEAIAQRLDGSGRIFYAVGSAHLIGEGGVVALLRARGINVERL